MALTDKLTAIADAIRAKSGKSDTLTLDEMPTEIGALTSGGTTQAELYTGDYIVTPHVDSQTLATDGKLMTDNVTIKAIPYYDTTNTAGGSTVYIAATLTE